jgi:hypothetical protein
MERTYTHDEKKYKVHTLYVGYFIIVFGVWMLIKWIRDPGINIFLFGLVAAVYASLNTFVFKAVPDKIIVDDESITFHALGNHKYNTADLEKFIVREQANAQFFIRLQEKGGKLKRYWVSYYYFSEREDLIDEIYYIEKKVNPNGLKFRGRESQFVYRPGQEKKYTEADFID